MTSMTMHYEMEVTAAGVVTFPGIDFSHTKPMRLVGQSGRLVVVHKPAGKCWSGVGAPRDYVPARFMVFEIVERLSTGRYRVEKLVEADARGAAQPLQEIRDGS